MIERVTTAIADYDGYAEPTNYHKHLARAAIEVMREPSEAMLKAGCISLGCSEAQDDLMAAALSTQPHTMARTKQRIRWRAMITAALAEGGE